MGNKAVIMELITSGIDFEISGSLDPSLFKGLEDLDIAFRPRDLKDYSKDHLLNVSINTAHKLNEASSKEQGIPVLEQLDIFTIQDKENDCSNFKFAITYENFVGLDGEKVPTKESRAVIERFKPKWEEYLKKKSKAAGLLLEFLPDADMLTIDTFKFAFRITTIEQLVALSDEKLTKIPKGLQYKHNAIEFLESRKKVDNGKGVTAKSGNSK